MELEDEVAQWLLGLASEDFGQAMFYIDLLEERGVALGFPYTSQLSGRLRELRFFIGRRRWRLSYFVTDHRKVVLLTVFAKSARRSPVEVARAQRAMANAWNGIRRGERDGSR